jgi:hypothetical protein
VTARKKWQLVWAPGSHFERVTSPGNRLERVSSCKRAYEVINDERKRIEDGHSDPVSVRVRVNEGFGWVTYEVVRFAPRDEVSR